MHHQHNDIEHVSHAQLIRFPKKKSSTVVRTTTLLQLIIWFRQDTERQQ